MITLLNLYGRLVHRLRVGVWCNLHRWGPWYTADSSGMQIRHCERCGWTITSSGPRHRVTSGAITKEQQ